MLRKESSESKLSAPAHIVLIRANAVQNKIISQYIAKSIIDEGKAET